MLLQLHVTPSFTKAHKDFPESLALNQGSDLCIRAMHEVLWDIHYAIDREILDPFEEGIECHSSYRLCDEPKEIFDFGLRPLSENFSAILDKKSTPGVLRDQEYFCLSCWTSRRNITHYPKDYRRALMDHPSRRTDMGYPCLFLREYIGTFATESTMALFWDEVVSYMYANDTTIKGGRRFISQGARIIRPEEARMVRESAVEVFNYEIQSQLSSKGWKYEYIEELSDLLRLKRGLLRFENADCAQQAAKWLGVSGITKRGLKIRDVSDTFIAVEFDNYLKASAWRFLSEEADCLRVVSGIDEIERLLGEI